MLIAGMNTTNKLNDCIDFAKSAESDWPESMYMPDGQFVMTYDTGEKAPDNAVLGPVTPRGAAPPVSSTRATRSSPNGETSTTPT